MAERKILLWSASFVLGVGTSVVLAAMLKMGISFWFPPFWPGMLIASIGTAVVPVQPGSSSIDVVLLIAGNGIFYAWIALRVLRAEIMARGRLSQYFLA